MGSAASVPRHREPRMARKLPNGSLGYGPAPEPGDRPEKVKQFLRLFLKNERRLYAYVLTLLPNRTDAEDVLQEATLVLWDKFDDEHPPDDFAAWGCRIAYFKV